MLDVLGCAATAPTRFGAASSYLVDTDDGMVLVDAGPGSLMAYAARYPLEALRGIVVTHLHADHSLDLMAWAYRWTFPRVLPRIPLFVPPGETARIAAFDALFGIPTLPTMRAPIAQAWDVRELVLDGEREERIAGTSLRAFAAHHAVPSAALRFTLPDGRALAFSSDTGYCAPVVEAARGADVFVCEATYLEAEASALEGHGHLTARMAGALAAEAGARHLVVSHLSDPEDGPQALTDAREAFGGGLSLATPGLRI